MWTGTWRWRAASYAIAAILVEILQVIGELKEHAPEKSEARLPGRETAQAGQGQANRRRQSEQAGRSAVCRTLSWRFLAVPGLLYSSLSLSRRCDVRKGAIEWLVRPDRHEALGGIPDLST